MTSVTNWSHVDQQSIVMLVTEESPVLLTQSYILIMITIMM